MKTQILSALKVSALAVVLSFGMSYAFAWTAPLAAPTTGNVAAPINTGTTSQVKAGNIQLNGLDLNLGNITNVWSISAASVNTATTTLTKGLVLPDGTVQTTAYKSVSNIYTFTIPGYSGTYLGNGHIKGSLFSGLVINTDNGAGAGPYIYCGSTASCVYSHILSGSASAFGGNTSYKIGVSNLSVSSVTNL